MLVAPTPRPRSVFFLFLPFFFVCFLFAQRPREGYVHTVSTSVDRCGIKLFVSKLIRLLYRGLVRLLLVLFHFSVVVEIFFRVGFLGGEEMGFIALSVSVPC